MIVLSVVHINYRNAEFRLHTKRATELSSTITLCHFSVWLDPLSILCFYNKQQLSHIIIVLFVLNFSNKPPFFVKLIGKYHLTIKCAGVLIAKHHLSMHKPLRAVGSTTVLETGFGVRF